jgi:hypothetical protein
MRAVTEIQIARAGEHANNASQRTQSSAPFSILHSAFVVLHSNFCIRTSAFELRRSDLGGPQSLTLNYPALAAEGSDSHPIRFAIHGRIF